MAPELVPIGAENYRPVITYRPALAPPQAFFGVVLAVVGLSVALAPGTRAYVFGVVIGSLCALLGVLLVATVISTRPVRRDATT